MSERSGTRETNGGSPGGPAGEVSIAPCREGGGSGGVAGEGAGGVVHGQPREGSLAEMPEPALTLDDQRSRAKLAGHEWLEYGPPIRGIAIVAILMGHTFDMAMFSGELDYATRCAAISLDSLFRWAVPAFIMISGAILAVPRPGKSVLGFYKKRLGRIGLPIVFWSAFFMLFDVYIVGYGEGVDLGEPVGDRWSASLANLAAGRPYGHMFFIFRFVGLYTLAPAVQWLNLKLRRRQFGALTGLLFIAVAVDSYIQNHAGEQRGAIIGTLYFLPYFMAGYLLRSAYLSRRGVWIALGVWAAATAGLVLSTTPFVADWSREMVPPSAAFFMWDHVSPLRIVIGISMWLVLITVLRGPFIQTRALRFMSDVIAPAAFGLYLIHPLFRDGLDFAGVKAVTPNLWIGVPVAMTCVILWTTVLTLGIMRVPYVRKIVV